MNFEPIGVFHCDATYPYDAARQPALAGDSTGCVELAAGHNYEQALHDLDGFSHVWLIYVFHHNTNWKPRVQPPRAPRKVGVFASRAPYRPNPIGLSCVALLGVEGRTVRVGAHDLLDGTPILDIKPYLAYADSVPDATRGWLEEAEEAAWSISFTETAQRQLAWLAERGVTPFEAFLVQQLRERPFDTKRKRVRPLTDGAWEIAYRTWRARFSVDETARALTVTMIASGYSEEDHARDGDPHGDKEVHRRFNALP